MGAELEMPHYQVVGGLLVLELVSMAELVVREEQEVAAIGEVVLAGGVLVTTGMADLAQMALTSLLSGGLLELELFILV